MVAPPNGCGTAPALVLIIIIASPGAKDNKNLTPLFPAALRAQAGRDIIKLFQKWASPV
jgi:hypothetical protein